MVNYEQKNPFTKERTEKMQQEASAKPDQHVSHVIKIDEARIQNHLDQMVRSTVEETLNGLLEAEADALCQARR